jgi:hypothetical protein
MASRRNAGGGIVGGANGGAGTDIEGEELVRAFMIIVTRFTGKSGGKWEWKLEWKW